VSELEPYPALLHSTEQKLRDASDLLRQYEQRHLENVRHITDLTAKVGTTGNPAGHQTHHDFVIHRFTFSLIAACCRLFVLGLGRLTISHAVNLLHDIICIILFEF